MPLKSGSFYSGSSDSLFLQALPGPLVLRRAVELMGKCSNPNQKILPVASKPPLRLGVELGGFEPPAS